MNVQFVLYNLSDGSGVESFNTNSEHAVVYPENALVQGRVDINSDHPIFNESGEWRVDNNVLTRKTKVSISLDKPAFRANGVDTVTLTFTDLIDDIQVNLNNGGDLVPVTIFLTDPVLLLKSDIAKEFVIKVKDSHHWSRELRVVAK